MMDNFNSQNEIRISREPGPWACLWGILSSELSVLGRTIHCVSHHPLYVTTGVDWDPGLYEKEDVS